MSATESSEFVVPESVENEKEESKEIKATKRPAEVSSFSIHLSLPFLGRKFSHPSILFKDQRKKKENRNTKTIIQFGNLSSAFFFVTRRDRLLSLIRFFRALTIYIYTFVFSSVTVGSRLTENFSNGDTKYAHSGVYNTSYIYTKEYMVCIVKVIVRFSNYSLLTPRALSLTRSP